MCNSFAVKLLQGKFKYHMTLRGGGVFAQTVRMPSYRGMGLAKSSYNFYSAEKV